METMKPTTQNAKPAPKADDNIERIALKTIWFGQNRDIGINSVHGGRQMMGETETMKMWLEPSRRRVKIVESRGGDKGRDKVVYVPEAWCAYEYSE